MIFPTSRAIFLMLLGVPVMIAIALLRPFKATLVALQFRHKAGEAGTRTFE